MTYFTTNFWKKFFNFNQMKYSQIKFNNYNHPCFRKLTIFIMKICQAIMMKNIQVLQKINLYFSAMLLINTNYAFSTTLELHTGHV